MPLLSAVGISALQGGEDVKIEMAECISRSQEGFLDYISTISIGNDLLQDISYKILMGQGSTIVLEVSGDISALLETGSAEIIESSDMLSQDYSVDICRTGIGLATFHVTAKSETEAREIAMDRAGDHLFSEHASEYEALSVSSDIPL
jgi:hypothetical protein